jgi:excisionase family DNA binding protein
MSGRQIGVEGCAPTVPTEQSAGKVPSRTRGKTGDSARRVDHQSAAFPKLLTLQDVADRCACSYWTARAWADSGKLPVLRLPGRLVRVRPEDFARFLAECAP